VALHLEQPLHELLARVVFRVRLAGQDELHGPLIVGQQGQRPVDVAQQQVEPLVGGHATGEPHR
jgi:hypothetical protein